MAVVTLETEAVTAADGTRIGWERLGVGPAIAVLHGGGRAAKHYRDFAAALADRYTVIAIDRRGRGQTGPVGPGPVLEAELDDLARVLEATGAELVFGHSAGALLALQAARRLPVRRLVVYEPPLVNVPLAWIPAFEEALRQGNHSGAFLKLARGLQLGLPAWLPDWLLALALRLQSFGAEGREQAALLETMPRDFALLAGGTEGLAEIACPTLVLTGAQSPGYFAQSAELLTRTLPDVRHQVLPGLGHNAPDLDAPKAVASQVAAFFASES